MANELYYTYAWQNNENGALYVGKGSGTRWLDHSNIAFYNSRTRSMDKFYNAVRKYGPDGFEKWIINFYDTADEAYAAESELTDYLFDQRIELYNVYRGSIGGRGWNEKTHTKDSRDKKSKALRKYSDEEERNFCEAYLASEGSMEEVAKALGLANGTVIQRAMERQGLKPRLCYKIVFTEEEEKAVCAEYLADKYTSVNGLSLKYNCSTTAIRAVFDKHNINTKSNSEVSKGKQRKSIQKFEEDIQLEICNKYLVGNNMYELADEYGCTVKVIFNILKRHDIKRRNNKLFSEDVEREICGRYLFGENASQLAKEFGAQYKTIMDIIKRYGVFVLEK